MTISNSNSSQIIAGDGTTTTFNFGFVGDSSSVISVYYIDSNNTSTLLAPGTYSINLNAPAINQIWGVGGTITYPLAGSAIAVGTYLQVVRSVPYQQNITTQNQGNFYGQVIEQAMDLLEMQIQQLAARTTQFRGVWLTGTVYYQGDIVQDGANGNDTLNYYICQKAHTSGTWSTDLANGDWTVSVLASVPTGNLTLTGDVTGSGTSPIATTLATVNSSIGTYTNATVTVNGKGLITSAASGSASSGTVTSVTYTGDGVLQSSTPSTAVTTSGTVAATLLTQAKNTVLAGPSSGSNADPTFRALVAADYALTTASNTLSGDVTMTTAGTYYDGPSCAQGSSGTWFVVGTITVTSGESDGNIRAKMWDGTTVFSSGVTGTISNVNSTYITITLSCIVTNPAGNMRISATDTVNNGSLIKFNASGSSKDSQINAIRIG